MKQYAGFLVLVWDSIGFAFRRFFFILADVRRHKDCCLVWNVNKRSAVIYTTNTLSRDNIVVKSQHCTTKTKCYSNVDPTFPQRWVLSLTYGVVCCIVNNVATLKPRRQIHNSFITSIRCLTFKFITLGKCCHKIVTKAWNYNFSLKLVLQRRTNVASALRIA